MGADRVAAADPGVLERETELAAIDEILEAALAGRGALAVIEAPSGMGKTRLVRIADERAQAAGLTILRARADELARDFAHGVIRDLFEPSLRRADPAERAELLEGAAHLAGDLLLGGGSADIEAGGGVEHALYWLAANLAERHPLLLLVDDAHWADRPSMRALAFLARRLDDLPICLVLSARPHEPEAPQDLLDRIIAEPGARLLRPRPLSAAATAEVVRQRLDHAGERFCDACFDASGGNPFLIGQLLSEVAASGLAGDDSHADKVVALGGRRAGRAVVLRLESLPTTARELARAVAILGDGTPSHRAAALAGLSAAEVALGADALARVELLRSTSPLRFTHAIVRSAIHESIPSGERSEAHRRAARMLHAEGAPAAEVAAHLLASDPCGDPWVVERLRAAADEAARGGAADVSVSYLERAAAEPPPPEVAPEIHLDLGTRGLQVQSPVALGALETAYNLARDPVLRARAAWPLAEALVQVRRGAEATAAADRALAELGDAHPALSLRLEVAVMDALRQRLECQAELRDRLARVVGWARDAGMSEPVLKAHQAWELAVAGRSLDQAVTLAEEALADQRLITEEAEFGPAWFMAVRALVVADRLDDAARRLAERLEAARRAGMAYTIGAASWYRADVEFRRGNLAASEADARVGITVAGLGHQIHAPCVEGAVNAMAAQGRLDEGFALLDEHGWNDVIEPTNGNVGLILARGRLRLAAGSLDAGLADILHAGELRTAQGRPNPAWNSWRSDAALALHQRGDLGEARRLADEELSLALEWGTRRSVGIALRTVGMVSGDEQALEQAVTTLDGSGATLEHARSLLALGAAQRRSGQRGVARTALTTALDLANRCGAQPVAQSALAELVATGARPRRTAVSGVDSLTPSERRVCELAVKGTSNRHIAQALFLTVKTVETHLSNSYGKLGISSKSELPEVMATTASDAA